VNGVADLPFERPEFSFVRLALGDFPVVVGAAAAVPVADGGDSSHMDGVVDAPGNGEFAGQRVFRWAGMGCFKTADIRSRLIDNKVTRGTFLHPA
jgi:hypothetical protein